MPYDVYQTYHISLDRLKSTTSYSSRLLLFLISLVSIALNTLLGYVIVAVRFNYLPLPIQVGIAGTIGLSLFLLGNIGGKVWQGIGYRMARSTYRPFVKSKYSIFSRIYLKFVEEEASVYFEAKAKGTRLTNPISIFKLIFRVSLSQLSFYIALTALLVSQLDFTFLEPIPYFLEYRDIIIPMATLGLSTVLLGLYLPMNFLIEDANLRTFDTKSRHIGTPSAKIRSRLDAIVGLSAITSGYSIFQSEQLNQNGFFLFEGDTTFLLVLDYISWLVFIMVISWPLILPAGIYYFTHHSKSVNKFKLEAMNAGVPIGVSTIRRPNDEEKVNIQKYREIKGE